MDLQSLVGKNIEDVKIYLDGFEAKYKIVESSDIQKKFDAILVTRVSEKDGIIFIVTDKFLLNI